VVVKDAAAGMAIACPTVWPDIEDRDDLFHAVWEVGCVKRRLEGRAYAAIAACDALREKRQRARKEPDRRRLGQQIRYGVEQMERAIARFDQFEESAWEVERLLSLCDPGSGRLRTAAEVETGLARVGGGMVDLGGGCAKVGRYLTNRAAGLGRYLTALGDALAVVAADDGVEAVEAAVRVFQAHLRVVAGGPKWDRAARRTELRAATRALVAVSGDGARLCGLAGRVFPVLERRHRASSAIENLHGVLRPYLKVQKGATQGFLDLFRFYWNTRNRQWGRHKGTSAIESLTGQPVDDWLTLLGYPPGTDAVTH